VSAEARSDLPAADLLYARLPRGRDRAEPLSTIAERLGWSRRHVESTVQELRLSGRPIGSDGHGVWVASDEEMTQTMESMRRRLASQYATLRAMREGVRRRQRAQLRLWT
jgi:biotin operon repressor